ncbi:hypothetical protein PG985_000110 [Apiospora marii]|uniref:uncharacterized protein n=1 Tax=Apiospora marii TaxID=335849 RepID=UPI00312D8F30
MASNLGTLPTPFAYNADCSTQMQNVYHVDLDYLLQGPPLVLPRCMPDNYSPSTSWFYSASNCPSGYTSACQLTQVVATLTDTYITCCPSFASTHFACQTEFTLPHQKTLGCVSSLPATSWTISPFIEESSGTTWVTVGNNTSGAVNAYSVQIRHGVADVISTETPNTRTSMATSIPSPTSTSTPTQTSSPSGLSTGAAAGIGVGCTVVFLGIMAAAAFLFFRRRRRHQTDPIGQVPLQDRPKVEPFPVEASASPFNVPRLDSAIQRTAMARDGQHAACSDRAAGGEH